MKSIHYNLVIMMLSLFSGLFTSGCKHSTFLDKTPDQALVLPRTLDDIEALLRNNLYYHLAIPALGEAATDDYYLASYSLTATNWDRLNLYLWQEDIYSVGSQFMQWARPYQIVFYANTVLDELDKIDVGNESIMRVKRLRAEALFHRSHMFYHLAQLFADPYNSTTASSKFGIPLRLSADVNENIFRASLQETYDRILVDLNFAVRNLPSQREKWIPSMEAAHALLARVYLTMGDFKSAKIHADTTLMYYDTLLDYNLVSGTGTYPFSQFNAEVLFHSTFTSYASTLFTRSRHRATPSLLEQFGAGDLRKALYFLQQEPGGFTYRGSYDGSTAFFFGLAVDEVILIRAECLARAGQVTAALEDLNRLRRHRFRTEQYTEISGISAAEVVELVLEERRRELPFRGLRWIDLRRLNEMGYGYQLSREYEGQTYTLAPGSERWTFPIPPDVLTFNPDMSQN